MRTERTESFLPINEINSLAGDHKANDNDLKKAIQNVGLLNTDSQVKAMQPKIFRRKFTIAEKLKIVEAFDACENSLARGALLRKEGLYSASIGKWKNEIAGNKPNHLNSNAYKLSLSHNQLARECAMLKKKLAQAEAIIDLQKKVSELLSSHVLKSDASEI